MRIDRSAMDDYTWLFYLPLIVFFVFLVVVSIAAISRRRRLEREFAMRRETNVVAGVPTVVNLRGESPGHAVAVNRIMNSQAVNDVVYTTDERSYRKDHQGNNHEDVGQSSPIIR